MATARVALLADTYHEVNGAARTCREWLGYARREGLPFLCVRWSSAAGARDEGSVRTVDLVRSSWAVPVDSDLRFDPWLARVIEPIEAELDRFRPDAIHVTSPGDLGIVGAILAARRIGGTVIDCRVTANASATSPAPTTPAIVPRSASSIRSSACDR